MAANGISTLATKELKQKAKLNLASIKRAANNNPRATYDITQLPTHYSGNTVVDNANAGGLVVGRPWTSTAPTPPFTFTETINTSGATITETNVGPLTIEARATSFQVNPHVDGYIKVNGTTVKTTTDGSRGHTLLVINVSGATVGSITTYDTFGSPTDLANITTAINGVASGNYIVLVSWDACAVDAGFRTALQTGYGATLTTTWAATRYSHIFIGKKV